jgi:hypothetical protein
MRITVEDQNGSGFWANSIEQAIEQCKEYIRDDYRAIFRIYVIDEENPYPGYIHTMVSCEGAERYEPHMLPEERLRQEAKPNTRSSV